MLELALALSTMAPTALAAPATGPAAGGAPEPTWPQLLAFLTCIGTVAIGATLAAWFLGAWRRNVQGAPRIAPQASIWPILLALLAAFAGAFIGGSAFGVYIRAIDGRELLEQIVRPPSSVEGDSDVATRVNIRRMQLSALSYVCAMAAALLTLWFARLAGWRGGMGARLSNLPRGALWGLLAALLVIPWMMTASILFQAVLKALDVQMDAMHELIRAIRDHPETELILWGLFSATVLAPLAEEVLFRGVLQTALVSTWARLFERPPPDEGRGFEIVMPASASGHVASAAGQQSLPVVMGNPPPQMPMPPAGGLPTEIRAVPAHLLAYQPAPVAPPPRFPPSALGRWVAIVLTSIIFAALHEPWSIPLIFVLSLALGYLYERTGNLWTTITLHFAFNSFNMLLILPFLLQ